MVEQSPSDLRTTMSTGDPNLPFSYRKIVDNPRNKPLVEPKTPTGTSSSQVSSWGFQSLGFTVVNPPKYELMCKHPDCGKTYRKSSYKPSIYERVKEVADRIIVQGFIDHILQNTGSKNIMLLSGDVDFALPLRILKRNGYKVFLAVGEDSKEELITSASIVWRMKDILKGAYKTFYRDPKN